MRLQKKVNHSFLKYCLHWGGKLRSVRLLFIYSS